MELIFATNNQHKIREIKALVDPSIHLLSLADVMINEDIPEEEDTLEGNAMVKARYVHMKTGLDVFADDTGLEVDALDGAPGVHSARFAGIEKDSAANVEKLLNLLKGKKNREARFRTVIALIYKNKEYLFDGIVNGVITEEKKGTEGFGYDPVFLAEGFTRTFAELSLGEKNGISHRARALKALTTFLKDNGTQ